jgi:lysine decarboxylase
VPQDIEGIDVGEAPTPYDQAEQLAAEAYGAAQSWFLTNGASQGNHALCLALARDRPVVVQRNSHASVVDGLVFSGGMPRFAAPEYDEELGMALCVTPDTLRRAVEQAPGAQAAIIVSPTYYGATADVAACAAMAHGAGLALVVDQAWGPHFGFHPDVPASALSLGADAVLSSTHKIAGSLTQSAMLHVADSPFVDRVKLARAVRLVRSTSPSSLLLASLDGARRQLVVRGRELIEETLRRGARARQRLAEVPGCAVVPAPGSAWPGVVGWDPMRVVIDVRQSGHSGHAVAAALRRRPDDALFGPAQVELATHATIVIVLGVHEPRQPLDVFPDQLAALLRELGEDRPPAPVARAPQLHEGVPALTPRAAWVAGSRPVPVQDAVGLISAEAIAGYPPGIPALLPGERITAEVVEHLRELTSVGVRLHGASDPALRTIETVNEDELTPELRTGVGAGAVEPP